MLIENALYADASFRLAEGTLLIKADSVFTDCTKREKTEMTLDCAGCTVIPGFIDIHTHGGNGADACDAHFKAFDTLSRYYARHGVTSFCPTTMTVSSASLTEIFRSAAAYAGHETGAYMHGINMEGPYISSQKKGAQNAAYIRKPDLARFSALRAIYPVSLVDIAPEVEGAIDFSAAVSSVCRVSAAHTDCTAEQALRGFDNGITHVTHFMNAMTGCKAREPGLIGAAFSRDNVTVELICDGFHVSPVNIAAVFRCFGEDRVCVVSDSMRCADCSDGEYELGGQSVYLSNGKALLADGTIAASVTNMHREFLNLLSFGIPFSAALKACTLTPARTLGVDKVTGSIADGKRADLTVLDENYEIKYVIARGKVVYER